MLGPNEIADNLINGRIVLKPDQAIAEASKWLDTESSCRLSETQLLAHGSGWYWIILYENLASAPGSYSIVHADGHVMQRQQAEAIGASIKQLSNLQYAGPAYADNDAKLADARKRYLDYLIREHGHITLEGLPADRETGAKKLRLENIYAPLILETVIKDNDITLVDLGALELDEEDADVYDEVDYLEVAGYEDEREGELVGDVLASSNRLAILGSPGCGKTTLLKRLAVAYAVPERLKASSDRLPERTWLPLVIRCRNLGTDVSNPILKTIEGLAARAEMPELTSAFTNLVMRELRAGHVLMLVDGLDEISSPLDRATFVSQLRTFLGTYPAVSLVVTSREFGFRTVAGAVASLCKLYRVGELASDDIVSITLAWHREVMGASQAVHRQAKALAESILRTDRVRRLAVNPLLLTTLLLVRRWLGELPRKRSMLYAKAIEVLLMTWNVEGHEPLDPEETLPQLAFAAFCMMRDRVQIVSHGQLAEYLFEARKQMPEILGYTRVSVGEFIARVEERSSLLSLSGHVVEDGREQATYEFKHLTFQEYLAALAATEGFYPDRGEDEHLVDALRPYIAMQNWREVIPLAGVLGGRESTGLVEHLIDMSGPHRTITELYGHGSAVARVNPYLEIVAQCVADDVPLKPATLERAIEAVITQQVEFDGSELLASRYGQEAYDIARQGYERFDQFAGKYGSVLSKSYLLSGYDFDEGLGELESAVSTGIKSPDPVERSIAHLWVMHAAYNASVKVPLAENASVLARIRTVSCRALSREKDPRVLMAGFWALCWLTGVKRLTASQTRTLLPVLWSNWRESDHMAFQRQCAWAIWRIPILDRTKFSCASNEDSNAFLQSQMTSETLFATDHIRAALVMGYYFGAPWSHDEIIDMVTREIERVSKSPYSDQPWFTGLLKALGPRGNAALDKWKQSPRTRRVTVRARRLDARAGRGA